MEVTVKTLYIVNHMHSSNRYDITNSTTFNTERAPTSWVAYTIATWIVDKIEEGILPLDNWMPFVVIEGIPVTVELVTEVAREVTVMIEDK